MRLDDGEAVPVTEGRFVDADPVFTLDGKHLAFLSLRSFDPIYDEHAFDLTFPASWRPFLVPLGARTPSPFGASPDGRPVSPEDDKPEDPPALDAVRPVRRDRRAARREEGRRTMRRRRWSSTSRGSPRAWCRSRWSRVATTGCARRRTACCGTACPVNGTLGDGRAGTDVKPEKPVLERFDLARRKLDVIADPVSGYAVSGDGTRLVVRDGVHAARAAHRPLRRERARPTAPSTRAPTSTRVDTRRIVVTVDPNAEWRQMFDEAARLMRDHFWVADMAGVDWAAEVARYRPLVDAVGSHDDLVDLLWELQGELGTSHAYVMAGGADGRDGRPGLLGADLEPADDGWRVARVLPPETSDPGGAQPAVEPGRRRAGGRRDRRGRRAPANVCLPTRASRPDTRRTTTITSARCCGSRSSGSS